MHILHREEVSYEILEYKSNFLQIKTFTFNVFSGWYELSFLKIHIFVLIKQHY